MRIYQIKSNNSEISVSRVMCLILTIQGVFLDFCSINSYMSQWMVLIEMKPLQA